jgi:hypothetical protein
MLSQDVLEAIGGRGGRQEADVTSDRIYQVDESRMIHPVL